MAIPERRMSVPDFCKDDGLGEDFKGKTDIVEGIFAINKPPWISSADVLNVLLATFENSRTFAGLRAETESKRRQQVSQRSQSNTDPENVRPFKMGHAGTLDPMASGVLIVGIGRGTKSLHGFLDKSKTYETVVLFGRATDTYDATGAVTREAKFQHITKELVLSKLNQFRGKIQQAPPVYSALKIHGVKACEYVRAGKELPRQLESREVHVEECVLTDWHEGSTHPYSWHMTGPDKASTSTRSIAESADVVLCPAPAARIRLTVSSGFYVRSFAHDLGIACSSFATMAELIRTRQDEYHIRDDVAPNRRSQEAMAYHELQLGESVWALPLKAQLSRWVGMNPPSSVTHINGRDPSTRKIREDLRAGLPRQRFRGQWQADTKTGRRRQAKNSSRGHLSGTTEVHSHAEGPSKT